MAENEDEFEGLVKITGGEVAKLALYDPENSDHLRMRVLKLRDDISMNNIEMGRMLLHIKTTGMFTQWRGQGDRPYRTFKEYVENEVDFKFRKAEYLVTIAWWFTEKHDDPKMLEAVSGLGWTKMAALVGVATPTNVDKWVELAKSISADSLKSEVKAALDKSGRGRESMAGSGVGPVESTTIKSDVSEDISQEIGEDIKTKRSSDRVELANRPTSGPEDVVDEDQASEDEPEAPEIEVSDTIDPVPDSEEKERRRKFTIMLNDEQRANVEDAIARAAEIAEIKEDANGVLLDYICTSFLALYSGSGSTTKERQINMRNDVLAAVQRALRVDIIAFDKGTMDPVFGQKTIDRLMEATDEPES